MRGQTLHAAVERGITHVAENDVGLRLTRELRGERATERAARTGDHHDPVHTNRYPPSTVNTVPVTNAEASETRNWYAPARSVAAPQRCCAVCASTPAPSSVWFFHASASGESNHPGATTLTVMPAGARSSASALARPTRPAFDALYAARPPRGRSPSTEPVKITRPDSCITRAAARAPRNAPVRFTSRISRQTAG